MAPRFARPRLERAQRGREGRKHHKEVDPEQAGRAPQRPGRACVARGRYIVHHVAVHERAIANVVPS